MASFSRLSDQNIEDPIYRGFLYDEIIQAEFPDTVEYEVKPDELFRPDLVSYRVYRTPDLDWLVLVAARVNDECDGMQFGQVLKLPSASWVRSRINYWASGGQLTTAELTSA